MALNVETLIGDLWPIFHATSGSDVVFTSDAELTDFFADWLKRFAENYGAFVTRDTDSIVFVSGTGIYTTPTLHLDTMQVTYGKPLNASSTHELECLDDAYQTAAATTQAPVSRWYADKNGPNVIGFYPVPALADAGNSPEVIYHGYPCNLDEAHESTAINTPAAVGDYLEFKVIAEAYLKESDFEMPEVGGTCNGIASLYEQIFGAYWGRAQ